MTRRTRRIRRIRRIRRMRRIRRRVTSGLLTGKMLMKESTLSW